MFSGALLFQLGVLNFADVHCIRASGMEFATCWWVEKVRRLSGYRYKFLPLTLDCGKRTNEPLGVRMEWLFEDRCDVAIFCHVASVHNGEFLADLSND